jgi:hypothetical protein
VMELKRMIEGITKKSPTDHRLYNKDDVVSWVGCWLLIKNAWTMSTPGYSHNFTLVPFYKK